MKKTLLALGAVVLGPIVLFQALVLLGGAAHWFFIGILLLAAVVALVTLQLRLFLRAALVWPALLLFMHAPLYACIVALSRWFRYFRELHEVSAWPVYRLGSSAPQFGTWYDLVIGAGGCIMILTYGTLHVRSVFRRLRQIENIPSSTVRAATIGLCELKGTARACPGSANASATRTPEGIPHDKLISLKKSEEPAPWETHVTGPRFYLEDETGKILVDPTKAIHELHWQSPYQFVLSRKTLRVDDTYVMGGMMIDGDPVYVIGRVSEREDAPPDRKGCDRLVVRPSGKKVAPGLIRRITVGDSKWVPSFDYGDVFLIADSAEMDLAAQLRRSSRRALVGWTLYLLPAIWLLAHSLTKLASGPA